MTEQAPDLSKIEFPCASCGALQTYVPGTRLLRCVYCHHETEIPESFARIREHDFKDALDTLARARTAPTRADTQTVHCNACAASFTFDQDIHSGVCPYCGVPVVLGTEHKTFKPASLLPFKITESEAKTQFKRWLSRLWFAPGDLKKYARDDNKLRGVYVPYWTYDSHTNTTYRGERGDYYQVPERYTATVNGKRVTRTRMVTRVRWTPVRGRISRFFDDVLVGASVSLPRRITDALEPWDLDHLLPYKEDYLSGFSSQMYQVDIDQGFEQARQLMSQVIQQDAARDIGGDVQRVHHLDTRHRDTTFKHLLLPVWTAGFRFRDKEYLFVVNGRTGKVKGERPYSKWKIFIAVVILAILGGALLYAQQYLEY